jgi:GNAT superfamily N-acetyltransferase
MTIRVLPAEEWGRLEGQDVAGLLPLYKPENVRVVVVEREGEIIAVWAALRQVTFEGLWVHPEHRTRGVIMGVLEAGLDAAKPWANAYGVTWSKDPKISRQIKHLGGRQFEAETYFLPMGGA